MTKAAIKREEPPARSDEAPASSDGVSAGSEGKLKTLFKKPEIPIFTMCMLYWVYVFRTPIWSIDDIYFATRDDLPHGQIALSRVWHNIHYDVMERNGRTADLWGQLVFATGPMIGILMAAIFLLLAIMTYWAIRVFAKTFIYPHPIETSQSCADYDSLSAGVGRPSSQSVKLSATNIDNPAARSAVADSFVDSFLGRTLTALIAVALPFTLAGEDPQLAGLTYLFMSATVGYVGGLALILAVVALFMRRYPTFHFTKFEGIFIPLLVFITAMHHEILALAMIGLFTGIFLTTKKRAYSATGIVVLAVSFVVSLGRFAAPGMWARNSKIGLLGDAEDTSRIKHILTSVMRIIVFVVTTYPTAILLFALGFVAMIFFLSRVNPKAGGRKFAFFIIGGILAMLALLQPLTLRLNVARLASVPEPGLYKTSIGAGAVLVLAILSVLILASFFWPGRWQDMHPLLILFGLSVGAGLVPFIIGSPSERPTFIFAYILMFSAVVCASIVAENSWHVCALWPVEVDGQTTKLPGADQNTNRVTTASTRGFQSRLAWSAVLVCVPVLVFAMGGAPSSARDIAFYTDRNLRSWEPTVRALQTAENHPDRQIVIPSQMPESDYAPLYIGTRESYKRLLLLYYGLDEDANVVFK